MQPKPHLKELAHALYFQTNSTQKQIAEMVGVHRRTVHLWIKHGDWQKTKAAAHRSPQLLIHDLYNQLEEMNTLIRSREPGYRIPTREEADIIRRLTMSIKDIDIRPLGDAVAVLEELTTEVYHSEPELAKRIIVYADKMIRRKNRHLDYYTQEEDEDDEEDTTAAQPLIENDKQNDKQVTKDDKDGTTEVTKSNNEVTRKEELRKPPPPPQKRDTSRDGPPGYRSWEQKRPEK